MDFTIKRHAVDRRKFLQATAATAAGALSLGSATALAFEAAAKPLFKISLAEWSLHRMLQAGKLDNLDFPALAKSEFDIDTVEYVSIFFKDKAKDATYLSDLKQRCDDVGVTSHLIMVDAEGALGDPDDGKRRQTVENHYRWVDAAKFLGCQSIRVNAKSGGTRDEQQKLAADGLRHLCEFAADQQINVVVENHGGLSSDGKWLAGVMELVNLPNCGTLPDFANFRLTPPGKKPKRWYDRYQGVAELMPYAKAVSAKSHEFDKQGNEVRTDYVRMLRIVLGAGYHSYIGIEWEGRQPGEFEGIRLTKRLLERVRDQLSRELPG